MVITPETEVRLVNLPLSINTKHQLKFTDIRAQENYFLGLDYHSLSEEGEDKFTYQRKDSVLYYPRCVDEIDQYNYCMYRNKNHENVYYKNKWIYAYIINMTFENDNCTQINLKTDVYQTWQFEIEYLPSFIEREHLSVSEDIPRS